VGAEQRKYGVVIEIGSRSRSPCGVAGPVARLAIEREPGRRMVRRLRRVVVLSMARRTHHHPTAEVRAPMARDTPHASMCRVQGDAGRTGVLPTHCGPRQRPMALLALGSQSRQVPVLLSTDPVARIAGRGCALILAVEMTGGARDAHMSSLEAERGRVVKRSIRRVELCAERLDHGNAEGRCEQDAGARDEPVHGR